MAIQKILLVDDSPVDLANLTEIVAGTGCQTIQASNGVEALEKAKSEQPDIIFMDIIMPEMDGYEACRLLSKDPQTKNIPIVFCTSKSQKADRVWAQMQGGKDLVAKPYSPEQIVDQIKQQG